MKILHVTDCLGGGVATYMLDIANELSSKHDITVAYSETPETPNDISRGFNSRIKLIKLPQFRGSGAKKKAWIKQVHGLVKGDYDAVHAHSSIAGFFIRVMTCLSATDVYYTPHGYSFLRKDVGTIKKIIFLLLETIPTLLKGNVIGCSTDEREHANRISLKPTFCVTNGVNLESLTAVNSLISANDKVVRIGICGRVTNARNPELFIGIQNDVCKIEKNVEFVWIGGGDADKVEALLSNNVRVTGWLPRSSALEELKSLDIYLQPSLWEGMPIAVLEAQALGKPAVVSNIIGNNEIVQNGLTGMLCDVRLDYVESILKLVNDPELLSTLSVNSKKNIHTNYNVSNKAAELSKIYEKL